MQAMLLTKSIQEGRSLLTDSNNLAAELEEMSQDDVSTFTSRLFLCLRRTCYTYISSLTQFTKFPVCNPCCKIVFTYM